MGRPLAEALYDSETNLSPETNLHALLQTEAQGASSATRDSSTANKHSDIFLLSGLLHLLCCSAETITEGALKGKIVLGGK